MKKLTRLLICAMVASFFVLPTPATASDPLDQTTLTLCTSLRTGYQLISKTGKCNERIYEARTWFQKGSAPSGTPGSKLIDLTTCISKSSLIPIIRTRSTCNSRTTTTALWQRPLGPPVSPSITSVAMGLLGTATLNIAAPIEDGGAFVTSYLVTSSPGAIAATFTPAQIKAAKITGLSPGSTYSFTVVAINSKGSSPSSIASAPTLAPNIPSAPSITQVVATGTNSAQLSFSAPLDNGGSPITSYVATSSPASLQTIVYQSAGGTINITNLSHSTTYTFTLRATNAAGSSLPSAISASITTATPPPPPEPVAVAPALAAPAFTLSSSSETRTVNTAATGFTINSTGGDIASFAISATPPGMSFSTSTGALTGTPTTVASATAYTITATNASGSATRTFTLTVTAAVYTVGQRGPGGGIVFYVSATVFSSPGSTCNTNGVGGSSTCKYLEVAPATWQSGGVSVANDLTYQWSTNTTAVTGQEITTASTQGNNAMSPYEKLNWTIGQGFYNTSVMKVSGAASAAQAAVLAYAGGSVAGQWFIPSMNELNELCKYARGQTTGDLTVACTTGGTLKSTSYAGSDLGGFVGDYYWSSSEGTALFAWVQYFGDGGLQDGSGKSNTRYVRPVRAF